MGGGGGTGPCDRRRPVLPPLPLPAAACTAFGADAITAARVIASAAGMLGRGTVSRRRRQTLMVWLGRRIITGLLGRRGCRMGTSGSRKPSCPGPQVREGCRGGAGELRLRLAAARDAEPAVAWRRLRHKVAVTTMMR